MSSTKTKELIGLQNGISDDVPKSIKFVDHQIWNLKYQELEKVTRGRGRGRLRGRGGTRKDDVLETTKVKPVRRVYQRRIKPSVIESNSEKDTKNHENTDVSLCKSIALNGNDINCSQKNDEIISEDAIHDITMIEDHPECEDSSTTKTNAFDFLMDRNKVISPTSKSPQTPKKRMKTSPRSDTKSMNLNKTETKGLFKISSALYMSPKSKKEKRSKIGKPRQINETFLICEASEDRDICDTEKDSDHRESSNVLYSEKVDEIDENVVHVELLQLPEKQTIIAIEEETLLEKPEKPAIIVEDEQKDSPSSKPSFFDLLMSRDKPAVEKKPRKRKRTRRSGDLDSDNKRVKNSSHDSASLDVDSEEECDILENSSVDSSAIKDVPKTLPFSFLGLTKVLTPPKVSAVLTLKKPQIPSVPEEINISVECHQSTEKSTIDEIKTSVNGVLLAKNSGDSQAISDRTSKIEGQRPESLSSQLDENTEPDSIDITKVTNLGNDTTVNAVKSLGKSSKSKPVAKTNRKKKNTESEDTSTSTSPPLRRSTRQRQSIVNLTTFFDNEKKAKQTPNETSNKHAKKIAPVFEKVGSTPPITDSILTPPSDQKKNKSSKKIAPIFDKPAPPILSPKSMAARLNFLHSGVPESLRLKQQAKDETRSLQIEFFTHQSHVQQRCSSLMWTLASQTNLPRLRPEAQDDSYIQNLLKHVSLLASCTNIVEDIALPQMNLAKNVRKGASLFQHCKQIATNCTKNFPVRYCFETFGDRNGLNFRPSRRSKDSSQLISKSPPIVVNPDMNKYTMWTKKYRPQCSTLLRSNPDSVKRLKEWLIEWQDAVADPSDEVFQSMSLLKNTMIVHGPTGCGKTAAVHALCAELDVNVLEINVSSRRSGKQLLQQVREATQSLQLGNHSNKEARMCVILIDDADLVFAHDENFTRELHTLVTSSKRPIVLTASDTKAPHISRYVNLDYPELLFSGISAKSMTTLLQILCLMEGVNVAPQRLGMLLEWNGGDIRRTLLHLQFWVSSGGDYSTTDGIHWNCMRALTSHPKDSILPHPVDIGMLWWNLPIIQPVLNKRDKTDQQNSNELKKYVAFLDSLSFCDYLNRTEGIVPGSVPHANRFELLETNELEPRTEDYKTDRSLTEDIQHCLLELHCRVFVPKKDSLRLGRDWLYSPPADARRTYSQQADAFNGFQAAMPVQTGALDHQAFAQDYFPYLRELCRSGADRQSTNPRRGNRGYNNLNAVGIYDIPPLEEKVARGMFQK